MGQRVTSLFQRPDENVQHVDLANGNAYRWPPKSGNYFGSHFIMGGERFESQQPEAFLFGENMDLNFLGSRPVPFPYQTPQLSDPTRTLRSLVNIRKDSIKLVKVEPPVKVMDIEEGGAGDTTASPQPPEAAMAPTSDSTTDLEAAKPEETSTDNYKYNVEFVFDCDVTCTITIMYFAREEMSNGTVTYIPQDASLNSQPYTYKRGANQLFSQTNHILDAGKFTEEEWAFDFDKEDVPIVIHCTVDGEQEHAGHCHTMYCALEKVSDGFAIKAIKQKQCVDGLIYILQEFYGIENKEADQAKNKDDDEDMDDNNAECVICMSEIRDTLILPCRHLCLCNVCADSLRYQASNCPICRAPFRALLQLRAIRKKVTKPDNDNTAASDEEEDEFAVSQKGVPAGYEAISLIEALNGPCFYHSKSADPRQRVLASQGSLRHSKKKKKDSRGSRATLKDKDKDKDVIIDEEKVREVATTEGEGNQDNNKDEGDDAVSTPTADSNSPKQSGEGPDDDNEDSATKTKSDGTRQKKEISSRKGSKMSDADLPNTVSKSGPAVSDSSDEDTYTLSARTLTTALPGTPDYELPHGQQTPTNNAA